VNEVILLDTTFIVQTARNIALERVAEGLMVRCDTC
jgi:hypothetical protein